MKFMDKIRDSRLIILLFLIIMFTRRSNNIMKLFRIFIIIVSHFFIQFIHARDSLNPGESIRDWEKLVSPGEQFVLGFFSRGNPNKYRYLGIWSKFSERYQDVKVVWVANRKNPFTDSSGVFTLTKGGSLTVSDGSGSSILIWEGARNSTLTLLDSGNLVLREESRGRVIWQSFDYPTDTLLPGMKLDLNHSLTSWFTREDPAPGAYTLGIDPNGTADQLVIWERGVVYWTSGVWNGESFSSMSPWDPYNLNYVRNDDKGNYFSYTMKEGYNNGTWEMDPGGQIHHGGVLMNESWPYMRTNPLVSCDREQSAQCMNLEESQCSYGNKFALSSLSFNYGGYVEDSLLATVDCKILCRRNCSCVAYASSFYNNDNGTGCRIWRQGSKYRLDQGSKYRLDQGWRRWGEGIYVRRGYEGLKKKKRIRVWFILVAASAVVLILLLSCCVYCFKRMFKNRVMWETSSEQLLLEVGANMAAAKKISGDGREGNNKGPELQLFSLAAIGAATDNFSIANRLGEGGFGPVFKGKIEDGQEIAVKRLSKSSAQGLDEFKTEITLIARLQHTNLVRLLGCCITGEEKILIYEFMPNNSLDAFLFDPTRRKLLDWAKRIHIIEGISQGLLYLHKFSRLKIIHRDLKASNILLDGEMNPKISDFGMARIFEGNQNQANTKRVVGTYGYMSPEYAMEGIFSVKSDVFSFGVLLLEIISGKKNTSFYYSTLHINLLGYVWELWKDDRCSELIDPLLGDSVHTSNLMRYIHVGLLCVQERAADRPTMSDVVHMLSNESAPLSTPKQPAFTGERNMREGDSEKCSLNNMTITEMQAR